MPTQVTFAELAQRPDIQQQFKDERFRTGFTGDINQWLQQTYSQNAGSNPYQISGTYNQNLYNDPRFRQEWQRSQQGITPEHARSFEQWVDGWVNEKPEEASRHGIISPQKAQELALLDEAGMLSDPDYSAELELWRQLRDGEIGVSGGGGAPMLSYRDVQWQNAPEHENVGYHLVDWEDLNVDDLVSSIRDTQGVKDERIRGITEMNAARDAAVQARKEAIEQALQESQNRELQERVRGGFVGNSFHSQGNMLKNTIGARQGTALEEAATRLENLKAMADGRLGNETLDYTTGVQAGEVSRDRDQFNLQGRTSVNMGNQSHKGQIDQFNSGQKNNIRLFNTGGINDTGRFNTSNRMQIDSINASNARSNAGSADAALNRRLQAAGRVNDMNQQAVSWDPRMADQPTFVVVNPNGTTSTAQAPSQSGQTMQDLGNGLFYWGGSSLMDKKP